ncbi:unnamed protein product [Trichogramma brassicae]|uniref:Uncharacterized protein n=1 Tax=Trichogramma brassicae TaxID=86971 RepID=A0A6H5HXE3_9HYME|nr:unnamed protein product [Trichogramma brassicae]
MNGLNVDDDVNKLRDRLMRFEIRTRFGDDKAMWDPVQDVASQMSAVTAASNNRAAVEATPLASSPNKLGNNFRHWRNMHNISESSSLMDTVIDGNAERARRVAEEESAESVAESELRDRVEDRVHTEQQRALESSNEGRSESENREEIVHSSEREEQIAPSEFERGPAAGATSTARRVAFANDANAMNKNKADRATLYQSEILGAGGNARGGANEHRAGDATGSRGSDDARGNRGLNTGTEIGGRGRTRKAASHEGPRAVRTGLRERGGSLTRYENSRYGANANGWSSVPDSTRGERRNSMMIENVAGKKISPRTDRVQEMAARSRTRSVTFRYSRLPGMSLQGEFPAGSVVYRQVMFRCTNNVRACYRGGRHICLTVKRPLRLAVQRE